MLGVVKSTERILIDIGIGGSTTGTYTLTKGQNPDNCVPFLSLGYITAVTPDAREWLFDAHFLDSPARLVVTRSDTTSRLQIGGYVVEFDPNKVRVQQKSFIVPDYVDPAPQYVSVNLDDTINTSRSAVVIYYRVTSPGAERSWMEVHLRAYNMSSTQVRLIRHGGSGAVCALTGNYFVFESLDGAFTTQYYDLVFNTSAYSDSHTLSSPVNLNKSWIVPATYYSAHNDDRCDSDMARINFQSASAVEGSRDAAAAYLVASSYVVEHHDDTRVFTGEISWAAAESGTKTDTLPDTVDLDYSVACPSSQIGMMKTDNADWANAYQSSFARHLMAGGGTQVQVYRVGNDGASWTQYQVIEFAPAPGYYVGGYVTEEGSAVERTVRSYRRDTGAFLNETTSSGVGGHFYLETSYSGSQYVVCVDDDTGLEYNALIYDSIMPTTISGG